MRQRSAPSPVPDRPHYLRVQTPSQGEHAFRLPRPSSIGRLVSLTIQGVAHPDDGMIVEASERAAGACLGICWAHPNLDLDARRPESLADHDDVVRYGEEVLDELHEAGYSQDDVRALVSALVSRMIAFIPQKGAEVDARVGFSSPPMAGQTSSHSTQG